MSKPPFRYVLDLALPVGKRAFVGLECGAAERRRLRLDELDLAIARGLPGATVCLCTHGLGCNILTGPYLRGLLGATIRKMGEETFLSVYRLRERPDRLLPTFTVRDMELLVRDVLWEEHWRVHTCV